jgi:hypothetical protein
MARGEVKEAVGQGSSPMREALCLRLKDGAVWEVVLAARCLEWRARFSLDFPPFEEQNFPFWECGIAPGKSKFANDRSASDSRCFSRYFHGSAPAWP